ncbi:MAG: tetratricopeptide repeat protein [Candidatus Hodarchaeota archaeon]
MQDTLFLKELQNLNKIKTILYTKQEDVLTVDHLIQQAVQAEPSNFYVWYAWGIIKKLQDNLIAAEKGFRKALELQPHNKFALHELARVLTFRKKYAEAEKIFLEILESDTITSILSSDLLLHIADNYIDWANDEFKNKEYGSWKDLTKKALDFILLALDLNQSERRIHELHKKICLDFGQRLFWIGNKEIGEKFLLRVVAEFRLEGQLIPTNKEALTTAYYNLAKYEKSKTNPNWDLIDIYVRKGLTVCNEEKKTRFFLELKKIVKTEKRRRIGRIESFNEIRKFGIIKSNQLSCIFFPKCLTWFCKDISALVDSEVSFIPVPHSSSLRKKNFKATQIRLIKT